MTGDSMNRAHIPSPGERPLPTTRPGSPRNQDEDASVNMDWYELFNVERDDFVGLAGSLTNPDYLNPQTLDFLYRFL